jgi:hypothetical protein
VRDPRGHRRLPRPGAELPRGPPPSPQPRPRELRGDRRGDAAGTRPALQPHPPRASRADPRRSAPTPARPSPRGASRRRRSRGCTSRGRWVGGLDPGQSAEAFHLQRRVKPVGEGGHVADAHPLHPPVPAPGPDLHEPGGGLETQRRPRLALGVAAHDVDEPIPASSPSTLGDTEPHPCTRASSPTGGRVLAGIEALTARRERAPRGRRSCCAARTTSTGKSARPTTMASSRWVSWIVSHWPP